MWKKLFVSQELQEQFIINPARLLKEYGMSSDFIIQNQNDIDFLKVLLSPKIRNYVVDGDHKNLLIELTNLGIVNESSYDSLKEQFKLMINNSTELSERITNSTSVMDIHESFLKERQPENIILNVMVIINVVVELNLAVHVNVMIGAAAWIYHSPDTEALDRFSNLDLDFQKEKDITLSITKNSKKLQLLEKYRLATKQISSFIDASIELGLLNLTADERNLMIEKLVEKTFGFQKNTI
jgi:hypothetical protein